MTLNPALARSKYPQDQHVTDIKPSHSNEKELQYQEVNSKNASRTRPERIWKEKV